jgi:hypothetical protein
VLPLLDGEQGFALPVTFRDEQRMEAVDERHVLEPFFASDVDIDPPVYERARSMSANSGAVANQSAGLSTPA